MIAEELDVGLAENNPSEDHDDHFMGKKIGLRRHVVF